MPFCTNSNFSIDMIRDVDSLRLDTLFFLLAINGGRITGNVFLSNGTSPLSPVTGTCVSQPKPDVSVVDLAFTWDTVTVSVKGVIFFNNGPRRVQFHGRFLAERRADAAETASVVPVAGARPLPIPPADGDTGTSTGQQT
jgi:hypothetical protein